MTLEEHYRTLAPRLTNWLIASGSPYAQACDLTQETFLKLWSMREQLYDNDAAVAGLAFTIARNLRKNQIRDNQRIVFTDQPLPEEAVENNAPAAEDMAYVRQRIQKALEQLPPLLREAYTLFQIAELSIAEIARETNATENLVKVRIHRAKAKLRELLSDLQH
ncbi:MAG: RNA polymerase sigma factor [Kiritimatiellae bacterium]|nr:RNA polymerase sigma factor [Kiritimatiellia bacterium]